MNYEKLYYAIINKALRKQITGQRFKGDGTYYESHHIKPRSLGGSDEDKNLVLLTAKEHYLCHWLLVKRYDVDSVEYRKMLKAWFMMAATGDTGRSKNNMRDYEKYKIEYSKVMSEAQSGKRNSQYGIHWYTSIDTGESKTFFEKPNDRWIEGRNWFKSKNRFSKIKFSNENNIKRGYITYLDEITYYNLTAKERRIFVDRLKKEKTYLKQQKLCQVLWDEYHLCNYNSFKEFILNKHKELNYNSISDWFKKYIPFYRNKILNNGYKKHKFMPNPSYVGVYE